MSNKTYKLIEDTRFPTLCPDENDHGFHLDCDCVEIPDCLIRDLRVAHQQLREAEDAIRAYAKSGLL